MVEIRELSVETKELNHVLEIRAGFFQGVLGTWFGSLESRQNYNRVPKDPNRVPNIFLKKKTE